MVAPSPRYLADPFHSEVVTGLADTVRRQSYRLLIHNISPEDDPTELLLPFRLRAKYSGNGPEGGQPSVLHGSSITWDRRLVKYRFGTAASRVSGTTSATLNSVPTPKVAVLHTELEIDQTLGLVFLCIGMAHAAQRE